MRRFGLRACVGAGGLLLSGLLPARLGGSPIDRDVLALPGEFVEAVREGTFDRTLTLRITALLLWICWSIAVVSVVSAISSRGDPPSVTRRLAVVGALVLGIGSSSPALAEPSPHGVPVVAEDESERSDPVVLTPTTVTSSLVMAGLGWFASRWWMERRRERGSSSGSDRRDSLLASIRRYDIEVVASASESVAALERSGPVFLRTHDGRILATTNDDANVPSPWCSVASNVVRMDESDVPRVVPARDCLTVHVGNTEAGELWCDLERAGSLHIDPDRPESDDIVRALSASLATSPIAPNVALLSDRESWGPRTSTEHGDATVSALRDSGTVVRVGSIPDVDAHATLVRQRPIDDQVGLRWSGRHWELAPLGVPMVPVGLDRASGDALIENIRTLTAETWRATEADDEPAIEARPGFLVSVLGPPEVIDPRGRRVRFDRSKSRELVVWLALHPAIQKRSLARDAMWSVAIKDATFSNITADVRRSMTLAAAPPNDEQWLGITLTDDLPLHPSVECDVDILRAAVKATRAEPEVHGSGLLRGALELVRGAPFAGSAYGWSDAIGIETDASLLVVRAATMLAEMCEESGDHEGVLWATARGLVTIPGHEDLVSMRLRLHSTRGDSKAAQREWESYRRSLVLDDGQELQASSRIEDLLRSIDVT